MRRHQEETHLPGWLWFFLLLPMGLVVALLYRQRRLPQMKKLSELTDAARRRSQELLGGTPARYTEPDSIPIDMHPAAVPFGEPLAASEVDLTAAGIETEGALGTDEEDVAMSKAEAQRDNFDVVEGIGPAINALLHDRGIHTFAQLANTPTEQLDQILTESRLRRLADPTTWAEQARLAADGKWDELNQLQSTLKAGRRQ